MHKNRYCRLPPLLFAAWHIAQPTAWFVTGADDVFPKHATPHNNLKWLIKASLDHGGL